MDNFNPKYAAPRIYVCRRVVDPKKLFVHPDFLPPPVLWVQDTALFIDSCWVVSRCMYAYRFRIVEMMLIKWFVLLAAVAHAATHAAPLCPIFPNPASVPAADVLGSPEVKDAVRLVDELLQNASAGIPS